MDPISAVLDIGGKILDRVIPDPTQRAQAQLELVKLQQSGELAQLTAETDLAKAQISVNLAEAQSEDKFSSRWRPFIGWVCGVAFAYHFILQPLMAFVIENSGHVANLPDFDMNALYTVLWGMLGLGTMRTIDRLPQKILPWRK